MIEIIHKDKILNSLDIDLNRDEAGVFQSILSCRTIIHDQKKYKIKRVEYKLFKHCYRIYVRKSLF